MKTYTEFKQVDLWIKIGEESRSRYIFQTEPENELETNIDLVQGKVLDVPCGEGRHLDYLLKKGLDVYGTDISQDMINKTLALSGIDKTKVNLGNIYHLPYEDSHFNTVLCIDALHHLTDPEKVIKELSRVLKDNCVLLLNALSVNDSTINCGERISDNENREYGIYSRFYDKDSLNHILAQEFSVQSINSYRRHDNPHLYFPLSRSKAHIHDYLFAIATKLKGGNSI